MPSIKPRRWTEEEIQWMKDNYAITGYAKAAKTLNRAPSSVMHLASRLGLRRRGEGRKPRIELLDGYIWISLPDARYAIHRLMMEKTLGRALTSDELVHHKDGNKCNNAVENLDLVTRSGHMTIHDGQRTRNIKGQYQ